MQDNLVLAREAHVQGSSTIASHETQMGCAARGAAEHPPISEPAEAVQTAGRGAQNQTRSSKCAASAMPKQGDSD